MKIKSIAFIEPRAENLNIYTRFNLPRLGSILLATILKKLGYETKVYFVYEEEIYSLNSQYDIIAVSTITATAPQAYRIADYYRAKGTPVIIGGPHVTFLPEEALAHADYCIRGEGEAALPILLDALANDLPLEDVPNLAYLYNGRVVLNEKRSVPCELDDLPSPDFSLIDYGKRRLIRRRIMKQIIPVQTSRGCPFDCTFCSVTGMFGKRYRYRSTEKVIAELKQYDSTKHKIFFYDDNFTANRKRSKELLRAMITANLKFRWSTQVRADVAKDPELLDLLREAGCNILYIGFESVDPAVLKEMKKSQTIEEIRTAIREIHARRIFIHGMFVFGFDSDTEATIRTTTRFAIKEGIDSAQFLILTPLPGSQFYGEMAKEDRIITKEWDLFDAHHVTFRHRYLAAHFLQKLQINAHTRFYSIRNIIKKLLKRKIGAFLLGVYAHKLNRKWQRCKVEYLSSLKALAQEKLASVKSAVHPVETDNASF